MLTAGKRSLSTIAYLCFSELFVTTETKVTSEPVPAVVVTVIMGSNLSSIGFDLFTPKGSTR